MNGTSVDYEDEDFNDPTAFFEKGRIKQLQDERVHIQKKTFTKWCNSFLCRARLEIVDLFTDVCDGIMLMRLLEIISGDKLGKPNRGRMRVHKIENLNRVLEFLRRKRIHMENIGAEDILDRNETLILGLIWTIILRFQIDDIEIPMDEEEETGEKKRAKDALLLWCQRKTAGYPGVSIENFSTSWRNGLGFNALIHAHRPDLVNYEGLNPHDHISNLNNAFEVADKKLGIIQLLDAEDIDVNRPDDKSVMTYISMYYHYFAKQKSEITGARRVMKVVGQLMSMDQLADDYEQISSDLLAWIKETMVLLSLRNMPNSLKGIQDLMMAFKEYRTVEKPPKYKEKGELEALFFTIQTKRKAMGRSTYYPPPGRLLQDIESAWDKLDKAEHARQVALNAELIRQEKLEQLARKFERKAKLRETWLREMTHVLHDTDSGDVQCTTAAQVEAAMKKHEAISADIVPREDRFRNLSSMASELAHEKYNDTERVRARERDILDKWAYLLQAVERRRQSLMALNDLMAMLRDIDALANEFNSIEPLVRSRDLGKHIVGVEDLIGKHSLLESQVSAQGDWMKNINKQAHKYIMDKGAQHDILQRKQKDLQTQYQNLVDLCSSRRNALERARELYKFIQDHEEEEAWIGEKCRICMAMLNSRDLGSTPQLIKLYKSLETEMQGHWQRSKQVLSTGEKLLPTIPATAKEELQQRINSLQEKWEHLRQLTTVLARWLKEAQQAQLYFREANEAESWMREKMPVVCSDDYGKDKLAADSLLSRHARLEEEIRAYKSDIEKLDELASELAKAEFLADAAIDDDFANSASGSESESEQIIEERLVPQVKVLYDFDGHGISIKKGQVLTLIQKTNSDWWRVLEETGKEGFAPAKYVQETKARTVKVPVTSRKKVKKEVKNGDGETVNPILERQKGISSTYRRLNKMANTRRRYLEDAIKLYAFYSECDELETWARETEKALLEQPSTEMVEASRNKFNTLATDIVGKGGTQLKEINKTAEELVGEGHSQKEHIRSRQHAVNNLWKELLRKRDLKQKALETAESVAAFNSTCEETGAWMKEKFDLLDQNNDAKDLKGLQALQRRHANLERELKPVEEKMRMLAELAEQVKGAYPEQAKAINEKLGELQATWADLKRKAASRRHMLEETQGQQMFHNAVEDLLNWCGKTDALLADRQKAVDVASAEDLLKTHYELEDELRHRDNDFTYVNDLGNRLLDKSPGLTNVKETLRKLAVEKRALETAWVEKEAYLKEMLDLQLFSREAEQIDADSMGHEAFLEMNDLGESVDGVDSLRKRHVDFESKLAAQDDRLRAFNGTADALIGAGHSECDYIDNRRKETLERRLSVKDKAKQRREKLKESLDFQSFKRDSEELFIWIEEKMKIASDESYKDGVNLDRKLQKHEAFEAEIKANADRLDALNSEGQELVRGNHYASAQVTKIMQNLLNEWRNLESKAHTRGVNLRQACEGKGLNRTLEDGNIKLDEMERALASRDLGSDLRGVKQLIQKHTMLEQEMCMYAQRIEHIVSQGKAMTDAGHFDSKRIMNDVNLFTKRFDSLEDPASRRRDELLKSRLLHQFVFDVDCELHWISEKKPAAASLETGHSLTDATNLFKKHEALEAEVQGHEPIINNTLVKGEQLCREQVAQAKQTINDKVSKLKDCWNELNGLVRQRRNALQLALKGEQFVFDAAEVESWMGEKRGVVSSEEYGQDEDAATKLLTKHRAIQVDMKSHRSQLNALGDNVDELRKLKHPDSDKFETRHGQLESRFSQLQVLAEKRRAHLEDAMCLYEYLRESQELEAWINEQLQVAMSEEYGQDFEHLEELVAKFDDFKQSVKTGSERFIMCESAAKTLLDREPPFAKDVLQRQEQLRAAWALLLDYIENRDSKLEAAEDIHRFNRDAADSLARIHEKSIAIGEDLGRDINSVQSLLRKHEAFENELVALEAGLQVLIEDSARLQQAYPGENAEHIASQQHILVEAWNALQDKAVNRRDMLNAAYDLQKFLATVRDLIGWTQETINEMRSERIVRDLQAAELLHKEHEGLKAVMQTRKEDFESLRAMGQHMLKADHYANDEINNKIQQVNEAESSLEKEWLMREEYMKQLLMWHVFSRDAKQVLANITTHEATLRSGDLGSSVEQVDSLIKKHETFEKLLGPLEEKVNVLESHGKELIREKHVEGPNVQLLIDDLKKRWKGLLKMAGDRKRALEDAREHAKFESDVTEAEWWIEEREKKLNAEKETQGQLASLQDKMSRLQKHQTFEAELGANEPVMQQIQIRAQQLVANPPKHVSKEDITAKKDRLYSKWKRLLSASQGQSRALEEARDLLNFNQSIESLLAWIRDKEVMLHAGDMGNDYEHCLALLKKLDDSEVESNVDRETSLRKVNELGEKLVRQGRTDKELVQTQLLNVNNKWQATESALFHYKSKLNSALEVHTFNRDVDDTQERIGEKAALLGSEETGKDIVTVEGMLRKQDEVERDMTAIHEQLKKHDASAQILLAKEPPLQETVYTSLQKLEEGWEKLTQSAETRRNALLRSHAFHKFCDELKKVELWAGSIRTKMASYASPHSVPEAQALLQSHNDRRAEISGRQADIKQLKEYGNALLEKQPEHKSEVQRANKKLSSLEFEISQTWEREQTRLDRFYSMQKFRDQVNLVESWLAAKEVFLAREEKGDSLDAVDNLIKKLDVFKQTMLSQSDKIDTLKNEANALVEKDPDSKDEVLSERDSVVARYEALVEGCSKRRAVLADSRRWQVLLKTCYELMSWINAKLQIVYDESYLDQTNLQSKLQKHMAFDAELKANQSRAESVEEEGMGMVRGGHFASHQIQAQLKEINDGWNELIDKSKLKTERLRDAYSAYQFNRKLDDLDKWLDKVEQQLGSEDHGKDLTSVANLIKRHDVLEQEINSRRSQVHEAKQTAEDLSKGGHFLSDEMQQKAGSVEKRFNELQEPCHIRKENLKEAQTLYQWMRQAEEEEVWMRDRLPWALSNDTGDSLLAAHNLFKKHQIFEHELSAQEATLEKCLKNGRNMIHASHFDAPSIAERVQALETRWTDLAEGSNTRRGRLTSAVQCQQYLSDAGVCEQWIRDRLPAVTSSDLGKDEDSVQSLLRKCDTLEQDVDKYREEMGRVGAMAGVMLSHDHVDSLLIKSKQNKLDKDYQHLKESCTRRRTQLLDAERYYAFLRSADDLVDWLKEKEAAANSEDYGTDLEDCQRITDSFEQLVRELTSAGERVANVRHTEEELLRSGHPYSASIKAKGADLSRLWAEVNEATNERKVALQGAKQVHKFDQEADETLNWLQEKEAMQIVAEQEDLSQADLPTIKSQIQKQDEFGRGVWAVEKQVGELCKEAEKLENAFPDTRDHLEVRRAEMQEQLKDVVLSTKQRHDKLQQAQHLQAYFQEFRDLLAWIQSMHTKITSESLPRDVIGCQALTQRHNEYRSEMKGRQPAVDDFVKNGKDMIKNAHVLGSEIQEKVDQLERCWNNLMRTWEERKTLYDQNLDVQAWKRDASDLEAWLVDKNGELSDDWRQANSVSRVEDLIRQYNDFMVTLEVQDDKFESIKRLTRIEQAFSNQIQKEAERAKEEVQRQELQKKDKIKTLEKQKILQERRMERERRKTQEVNFFKPNQVQNEAPTTLPRRRDSEPKLEAPETLSLTQSPAQTVTAGKPPLAPKPGSTPDRERAMSAGDEEQMRQESAQSFLIVPSSSGTDLRKVQSFNVKDGGRRQPKRTPTFTTRRPHSLKKVRQWEDLESIDISGTLERKQELQSGGKKATIRSWKQHFTILCGQLLCFFKDEDAFMENVASAAPVYILNASCVVDAEYTKRKHAFRLRTQDGAEFLFASPSNQHMREWVDKITFHATLPPSLQLKSFDEREVGEQTQVPQGPAPALPPTSSPPPDTPKVESDGVTEKALLHEQVEGMRREWSTKEDSGFLSPGLGLESSSVFDDAAPITNGHENHNGHITNGHHTNGVDSCVSKNGRLGVPSRALPVIARPAPTVVPFKSLCTVQEQGEEGVERVTTNGVNGHENGNGTHEEVVNLSVSNDGLNEKGLVNTISPTKPPVPARSATLQHSKQDSYDNDFVAWVETHGEGSDSEVAQDGSKRSKKRSSKLGSFFKSRKTTKETKN